MRSSTQRSFRFVPLLLLLVLTGLVHPGSTSRVFAQGSKYLQAASTQNNGLNGVIFEITATRSVRLYRFSAMLYSGSNNVEIWARPNGQSLANDGQWIFLGSANGVTGTGSTIVQIPINLNFLINPNQTWGFAIFCPSGGMQYLNGVSPYIFSDSYLSINTTNGAGISGTSSPGTNTTSWASFFTVRQLTGGVYYDDGIVGYNDAGITAITSPLNSCAGVNPVKVKLNNFGYNRITSCTVNWTLNGVAQTPYAYTGLLDTLNATTRETEITLGSLNMTSGVPYTIRAWTTNPNGLADTVNVNDTTQATRMAALAGTFTVGGTSPSFATLTDAAAALNAYGVCGPVVLNVRNGVYTEQVTFKEITGASSTNTITLQSESGNKSLVTIQAAGSSTAYHTILLDGTDWMRIRNLTIAGTNATYGRIVTLLGGATNNVVENNNIFCATGATASGCTPIYMYNAANNNNRFENNDLRWGYYGSYIYGISTTSLNTGTKYLNNRISDMYYYGLYMYYQDAPEISGNTWVSTNTTMYYGMYLGYCQNALRVIGNRLSATATSGTLYGMYVYYCTATTGNEGRIANNFIHAARGSSTVYGMYVYYSNYQNIDFNTVNLTNTYTLSTPLRSYYGSYHRYQNNIFTNNGGGLAVDYYYTSPYRGINYNVYYTSGTTLAQWNGVAQTGLANLQTTGTMDANSIVRPITYRDMPNGDLHLSGASQNDVTLTGLLQAEITADIDGDPRVLPYRGADEACYILPNTVTYRIVDGENQDVTFATIPGSITVRLNVAFPAMGFPITATVNFYTVPGNQLAYSTSFNATKLAGQTLTGNYQVAVPSTLVQGYYRINVVLSTQNSCGDYINYVPGDKGLLLVGQGNEPCIVWPGDVNNDGIANYGDRTALNKYIFNANLRPSWLTGPARYRADAATNPMTYFTWEGQAGAPWQTPEGCYMDADGNGTVNTFDLLPVKVNFLRTHGTTTPKHDEASIAGTFGIAQNYPNPFHPSTTLQYAVPEKSTVKLVVTDMLGREVAVLVDGEVEAGVRTVVFDASALESGVYMARYEATGIASGITSSRIVKMTLAR
jgi:hypothetical protein